MPYHLTLMGYHLKFITATCESCLKEFEKPAVSLARQCEPCKRSYAMRSMEQKRPDRKREKSDLLTQLVEIQYNLRVLLSSADRKTDRFYDLLRHAEELIAALKKLKTLVKEQ